MSQLNQFIHNHWLTHCALKTMPALALAMRDLSPNATSVKVSEHTLEAGKFTHLAITLAIQHLRRIVKTPIELFRSDYPLYNFNEMMNVINWASPSYRKESEVYTHFSLASPYVQSYPNDSMDIIYASQIFSSVMSTISAPDNIFASLSEDKEIVNARKAQAHEDLVHVLTARHKELKNGGRVVIDLAGEVVQYEKSVFKLVNEAIRNIVDGGFIKQEIMNELTYPTHYRSYPELKYTLESLSRMYKILEYREELVPAPFYLDFKKEGSRLKYADEIVKHWGSAMDMILAVAKKKQALKDEEGAVEEISKYIFKNVQMEPPVSEMKTHVVVLEKI